MQTLQTESTRILSSRCSGETLALERKKGASREGSREPVVRPSAHDHTVQFYEDDAFLVDRVCRFVREGIEAGHATIVIATAPHRAAIKARLLFLGFDLDGEENSHSCVQLDAEATLEALLVDGWPDADRFKQTASAILAGVGRRNRPIRAFGEMVALLWARGLPEAALRLEQLWNELISEHSIYLLCAYPIHGFQGAQDGEHLQHICNEHSHVVPAESYSALPTVRARLQAVTRLQRQSALLQTSVSERQETEQQIRRLAEYDTVTGLPNRALLLDRLEQAVKHARRDGNVMALVHLDLDRFTLINDTLGHGAGDEVLRIVAARLQTETRDVDTVARLDGDDFALVLGDLDSTDAAIRVAERLLHAFAAPIVIEAQTLYVSPSIGLSLYPADSDNADTLLNHANMAMRKAKRQGGNRHQFFTRSLEARSQERLTLESRLRHALEQNELLLHYQPVYDLRTGLIESVEALVRWQPPGEPLISPAQFIPIAEETGLIVPMGEWVLKTACAQTKVWHDQGWTDLKLAVNFSARQLREPAVITMLNRTLLATGLNPRSLTIELTEGTLLEDVTTTSMTLQCLKTLGVRLSLDDFGTAYSSLGYLKRLPIDILKIDQSFVRDLATDAGNAAIVTAILAMARAFNLHVVAEGIETEAQLAFLRKQECPAIQGYLLSRPVAADQIAALLEKPSLP